MLRCRHRAAGAFRARVVERDGIRSRHIVVANLVAFAVTGFRFALLQPPGRFGLHLVSGPAHDATDWHFHWGLGD
jgi:hypothetical protein